MRSLVARVEADLGQSIPEYLSETIIETGCVKHAMKVLIGQTDVRVSMETVKDWWFRDARKTHPELYRWTAEQRAEQIRIRRLVRAGERAERQGLLAEIGQIKNGVDGTCCQVCGAPLPTFRIREDTTTCSPECSQLWGETRYHTDDTYRDRHRKMVARGILANGRSATEVRHAKRVLAGAELEDRGRWTTSPTVRVQLEAVMDRRAQAKAKWGDLAADLPPIQALEKKPA